MIFVLQESKFKETGVVTPQEFVNAGDHLVHACPTWEWACGDESKTKSYLPKNKQYLITRNVPCSRRCKQVKHFKSNWRTSVLINSWIIFNLYLFIFIQIENCEVQEKIVEDEDGDEGWVETHHLDSSHSPLCGEMSTVSFEVSKPCSLLNHNNICSAFLNVMSG